jgi:hypothetical protein
MEAKMQPEQDADVLAQNVVNAWGVNVTAGNAELLSAEFKALFEKTCAYREAKRVADNRRELTMLTEEEAVEEKVTRNEFLESYRSFHEAHR